MPPVRKIAVQTMLENTGNNAAECLAWFNDHQLQLLEPVPNGWVITHTAPDGTLTLDCPGGNGGGGFPVTWPVGGFSPLLGEDTIAYPNDGADVRANMIDAP